MKNFTKTLDLYSQGSMLKQASKKERRLLFTSNFLNRERGGKHYLASHFGDVLC